jgi:hypothetical protein
MSEKPQKSLEVRFQTSFMFGQYFEECMETEKTLRGNCWSLDVLVSNINTLLDKFLKSQVSSIEKFFRSYIVRSL